MAVRKIDSIIDEPAVQAQYDKLIGMLNELAGTMDKVANIKIGAVNQAQGIKATQEAVADLTNATTQLASQQEKLVGQAQTIVNTAKQQISTNAEIAAAVKQHSGSIEENIRLQIQLTKQLNDNKAAQKELSAAYKDSKITAEAFDAEQTQLVKTQLDLKNSISTVNGILRQQTQENKSAEGSYKLLNAQLVQLRAAYREMSAEEKNAEGGQALNAQIQQLDQALKAADGEMGIHVRHVGNYTGALKTLESGLAEAQAQLQRFTETGQQNTAAYQQAQAEVDLFTQLLARQQEGFASVSMEIRTLERSLATMVATGMEETEVFKKLQLELAGAQRKLHDFKEDQALLKSDLPTLSALTTAAKGLAGMYALGAGTAALFADGNEKVEKELNKLVAVMTVLQGLQEVHELLERRGAVATIASGIAQGFKNFIMTGSVKAQQESTIAQEANTVAQEANVAATEADVVAKEAQAAATVEATAATKAATGAAIGLRVALLATGIGALLILIPAIANAMNLFGKSAKELAKLSMDLAEAEKAVNEVIVQQIEVMNNADQATKKYYENQLALASAAGKNQYEQLALKKKIAEAEKEDAKNTLDVLQGQLGKESELLANYQLLLAKKEAALKINRKALEDDDSTAANASKNLIDMWGKQADAAKASYDAVHKAHNDLYGAIQKDGQLDEETTKLTNEERRKLELSTAKIIEEARISANERVLNNERSTYAERLAANQAILQSQVAIARAELNAKEKDPSITPKARLQAERETAAAIDKLRLDTAEKNRRLNLDYWKRDFDAYMEIQRAQLDLTAAVNSQIADDQNVTLDRRLLAYLAYEAAQKRLIDQELFDKLSTENLTDKEVEAAQADHQNKLNELTRAGIEKRKAFQREGIETNGSRGKSEVSQNYNADASALADSFARRQISQEKYTEERKKLDEQYQEDSIRIEMETTRRLIDLTADGTKERYDLEAKLAEDNIKLADLQIKKTEELNDRRAKAVAKYVKYEQEGQHVVQSLVDDSFTRRLNNIQKQEEANTRATDKEITEINNSTLSAQDKAAKITQAQAQAKVQQDALDKEKRDTQLRQAKFDRDAQVLEIIGKTLASAAGYGWITPAAIAVEAEGLVEAALLASKPLPRFKKGTDSSPEGWALTDEEGPELYRRPSGEVFLGNNRPTLRYLEAGTEIIPYHQVDKILQQQVGRGSAPLVIAQQQDTGTARELRGLRADMRAQTKALQESYSKAQRPIYIYQKPDLKARYIP